MEEGDVMEVSPHAMNGTFSQSQFNSLGLPRASAARGCTSKRDFLLRISRNCNPVGLKLNMDDLPYDHNLTYT
jgi:hypothetical protein